MEQTYDVVIIGTGFTGLSAGIYTGRARLKTLLLESTLMGGQIINTDVVENYPGFPNGINGAELIAATEEQATKAGVEYGFDQVTGIDVSVYPYKIKCEEEEYIAKSVIVATGGDHVKLGVPGEKELEAKGVSYCATCDGNFFADQDVTVVGGGDSAIEEGLYLTRMCSQVSVVHRRKELRASKILQERAFSNPKMNFIWDSVVDSINGDTTVRSLDVRNVITDEIKNIKTEGIFIYIGFYPATKPFAGTLDIDDGGHIKVALDMSTSVDGIFAAGDCRWKSTRQLANSGGDGVTAAISAYEWLENR